MQKRARWFRIFPGMKDADAISELSPGLAGRVLTRAAVVAAMALVVALAVRPIASYDVGYHLAYGQHFLDTGEIVQTNRFVYTHLDPDILADPANLGPGCRYDNATDTYHFVNANWLSQVVMSAAWRAGGSTGLGILQAGMIAAIFLVVVATMRRATWHGRPGHDFFSHGRDARATVSWYWIGPAVVLVALAGYERFNIRPEVFGYLILVLQWWLLVGTSVVVRFDRAHRNPATAKRDWRRVAGVIGLQILAVNLHSYFILGVTLVGAMFTDIFLRWLWARAVTHADMADLTPRLKWFGIALAGVVLACLVNPFFIRGAIMPIETLLFMAKHNIIGGTPMPGERHPWATIGEFFSPFAEGVRQTRVITAYYVVLCVAGVAGVVALMRRRWGWVLVLVGMTLISTRMRRNIAPAAMIIVPLAMIILTDGWNALREKLGLNKPAKPLAGRAGAVVALVTIALAGWWTISVASNRFYFSERRAWRFGWGVSEITVPLKAARWIDTHKPAGKVFCDYGVSSNLMYFTDPHRRVPVLTNTWAYPPYVMKWVSDCTNGRCDFEQAVSEYDIGTVVLRLAHDTAPLMKTLAKSEDWSVADIGVSHVVFLRRTGTNAELAKKLGITKKNFDVSGHIERIGKTDPLRACALHSTATLLYRMDWGRHAITVWRKCIEMKPDYYEAIGSLGICLALRGTGKMLLMQAYQRNGKPSQANRARSEGLSDWAEAEKLFKDALKINPDYDDAARNLRLLHNQMASFRRGVIIIPQMR